MVDFSGMGGGSRFGGSRFGGRPSFGGMNPPSMSNWKPPGGFGGGMGNNQGMGVTVGGAPQTGGELPPMDGGNGFGGGVGGGRYDNNGNGGMFSSNQTGNMPQTGGPMPPFNPPQTSQQPPGFLGNTGMDAGMGNGIGRDFAFPGGRPGGFTNQMPPFPRR